jgi:hypothetical protein
MHQLSAIAFLASLLLPSSSAQNNSNTICSDLELNLRYNASTTRQIPALRINGTRPSNNYVDEGYYSVENDTSRTWSLTCRINNMSTQTGNSLYTQDTLLLDTGDSNMTNMGSCHQTMAPGNSSGNFQWTKEVLQRSLKDTGDCRATLGDGCVDALKEWYTEQAASNHMRRGNCRETNTTLPEACHGVLEPRSDSKFASVHLFYETQYEKKSVKLTNYSHERHSLHHEPKSEQQHFHHAARPIT